MVSNHDAGIEDLYVPFKDNATGNIVWMPNPNAGMELPETYGTFHLGRSELYHKQLNSRQRVREWNEGKSKRIPMKYY